MDGIKGLTPLVKRRIGSLILSAIREGKALPDDELPTPPRGRRRRRSSLSPARLERLRAWRKKKAVELGLDPGVLFPQATLEALASAGLSALQSEDSVPGLRDWRRRLLLPDAPALLG
jgi:ribonuclease D